MKVMVMEAADWIVDYAVRISSGGSGIQRVWKFMRKSFVVMFTSISLVIIHDSGSQPSHLSTACKLWISIDLVLILNRFDAMVPMV
jgi:hypothetical protein